MVSIEGSGAPFEYVPSALKGWLKRPVVPEQPDPVALTFRDGEEENGLVTVKPLIEQGDGSVMTVRSKRGIVVVVLRKSGSVNVSS
jgi:hypothetical protein